MLKSAFKEAFRHNCETSQYGSEQPQIFIETSVTVWYFQLWAQGPGSLFSELLLLCNCHRATEMQQGGCCFTKGGMLVLLLHWAPPFVLSWVGRGAVRADQTSATAEMSVQNVCSQPPVTRALKWKEMPYSAFSEKCSAVFRAAEVYKLLKWHLLAYLATKLSSPMFLNLLFAKFWLWLQLGPFTESMWMQFMCSKRG